MSEILKELWSALQIMNGAQWVVLIALAIVIGVGLFWVFRWLYTNRFEAQENLIELKNKTIEHYKEVHVEKSRPKPLSEIIPEAWQPYLEQPFRQLEEVLEEAIQQQQMNYTSANMGFIKDAELYILYLKVYYSLPTAKAEEFKSEQQQWLKDREAYCESEVKSHGGSLAPLEYGMAFISKTQERIVQLLKKIV